MNELVIIRHGLAHQRDPKGRLDDRARRLTPAGRKKFRSAAAGLRSWAPQIDVLLTSPLVRATETAAILTETAKWPKARPCAELDPAADPASLLTRIHKSTASRIALVGHEPQLSQLIGLCIGAPGSTCAVEVKKGAAAVISFAGAVRAGRGTLTALLPPRLLRQLG